MRVAVKICPKCKKEFDRKVDEASDRKNYTENRLPEYCTDCYALVKDLPEERLLQAIFGGGRGM